MHGRGVPSRLLQALGNQLGRRRSAGRPAKRSVRRPTQGPRHRPPGHLVQGAGLSFERTLAATLAGDLPGGRAFAAANAECVFVAAPSKAVLRKQLAELRAAVLDRDEYGDRAQLPTTASSGVLLHAKSLRRPLQGLQRHVRSQLHDVRRCQRLIGAPVTGSCSGSGTAAMRASTCW